jgi:hypothetical protein
VILALGNFAIITLSKGNTAVPLGLLGILVAATIGPRVLTLPLHQILVGFFFLMLFLDVPAAPAYYHVDPFTEILGGVLLFNSLGNTLGIPGLSILPIDLITYGMFLLVVVLYIPQYSKLGLLPGDKTLIVRAGMVLLAAILAGVVWGLAKGHQPYLMFIQVRFLFYLYFWFMIGFWSIYQVEQATAMLNSLTFAMVFKSLIAIYIYWTELRQFADAEYLVDHHTSIFWGIAMIYIFARCFLWNRDLKMKMVGTALIALLAYPYILNDRRTSFLGIGFTFVFMLVVLKREQLRRLFGILKYGLPVYLVLFINHWIKNQDQNPIDYRDLENFNILAMLAQSPLLGFGFGQRFEMVAPMPDISLIYPLFDLIPHNTMLAFWAYGGPFAMAALSSIMAMGFMSNVYLTKFSHDRQAQLFGLAAIAGTIQWLLFCFADLGLMETRSSTVAMVFTGVSIGLRLRLSRQEASENTYG